ncbi:MAG: hypothetical protein SOW62_04220, partial [Sodaliphilus sp.]|nr:hypothetical protein [Sodaliphilus sp.]
MAYLISSKPHKPQTKRTVPLVCEMSEAKWSIAEAKCLQMSHNKYASQRDAISPLYGNLMLS